MAYSGNPSLAQQIAHARVNFPDKLAMFLELTDNSFDHGDATISGIIIKKKSIVHVDNGNFSNDRMKYAWCKNTGNLEQYYTKESRENKIGKWNCGLTDASMIWGDIATLFIKNTTNNVVKYFINTINWEECGTENKYSFNVREANSVEVLIYQEYINVIGDCKNATVIEFGDLVTRNNNETIDDMVKTYKGVYGGKHVNKTVIIENENKREVIKFNDYETGSQFITQEYNYYSDDKQNSYIIEKDLPNTDQTYNLRFSFKIKYGILTKEEIARETEYYGILPSEMSGHRIFRGDRCVSGKFGLNFGERGGMYRNKGGRAYWYFPTDDIVDVILSIGTNKSIREPNIEGIKNNSKCMAGKFKEIYLKTNKLWENYMKGEKEKSMEDLIKMEKNIPNMSLVEIGNEKELLEKRFKNKKFTAYDGEEYDGRAGITKRAKKILSILVDKHKQALDAEEEFVYFTTLEKAEVKKAELEKAKLEKEIMEKPELWQDMIEKEVVDVKVAEVKKVNVAKVEAKVVEVKVEIADETEWVKEEVNLDEWVQLEELEQACGFGNGELINSRESDATDLPPLLCDCGKQTTCGGKKYPLPEELCNGDCYLDKIKNEINLYLSAKYENFADKYKFILEKL